MESEVAGGFLISYPISISNTNASSVALAAGECSFAEFVVGDCCQQELQAPLPPAAALTLATPNPDLFFEELTFAGLDIAKITYGSDCTQGNMRNEFSYDADHRVTAMANTVFNPGIFTDRYSTAYAFDAAGNITALSRNGQVAPPPPGSNVGLYGQIDNLLYS